MRQALGKGIGALIPTAAPRRAASGTATEGGSPGGSGTRIEEIPIDAIEVNPRQPRTEFEADALEELARSIAEQGVLQPVLVRPIGEGRYQLIAGERRLRASRRAGLASVPAVVRATKDDESLAIAIIENIQRADLGALEEAHAYRSLIEEFGLTQEEVARRVGKSRPAIANSLRLLQLPETIQAEIRNGALSAGHARALLAVEGDRAREVLAREISTRGLSVREAEQAASRATRPAARPAASRSDPDIAGMERDLSRVLGTKVVIATTPRTGRGRLEVHFYSHDDLAHLVRLLSTCNRAQAAGSAR